ncbi:MAG: hypothetical protein EPGJADBJ_01608 [Saprospiraceae bacterium]|nr:hypothetical protein [Saprospiraceae bacterium]
MPDYHTLLSGGDLRSIGNSDLVVANVRNPHDFDELFEYLFQPDRLIVMRTADAIEKITVHRPEYLKKHRQSKASHPSPNSFAGLQNNFSYSTTRSFSTFTPSFSSNSCIMVGVGK